MDGSKLCSRVSEHSLEEEVRTSLQAYQALWGTPHTTLASISRIISSMSDVRAAFMTRDRATIRDTAQELWSQDIGTGCCFPGARSATGASSRRLEETTPIFLGR